MAQILSTSLIALVFSSSLAAAPLTKLSTSQLKLVFDRADQQEGLSYLQTTGNSALPSLQILPATESPKTSLPIAAQCIKLYNCNENVCLVDYRGIKYALSDKLLKENSKAQTSLEHCEVSEKKLEPPSLSTNKPQPNQQGNSNQGIAVFYKIQNVVSSDSLNIRTKRDYKSTKVGRIPSNGRCVSVKSCTQGWCRVSYQNITGWSKQKYLGKMPPNTSISCPTP